MDKGSLGGNSGRILLLRNAMFALSHIRACAIFCHYRS
jgi:hypothetical protein